MIDPIAITGSALATALGITRDQTWDAILKGQCGIRPPTEIESPLPHGADAGQALDLPPDFCPDLPREARYLKWTIEHAVTNAGFTKSSLPVRTGVLLGTTLHGVRAAGQFLRDQNPAPLSHFLAGNTLELATRDLSVHGLCATTCSACSSSLGAIALAITLLQSHQLDLVIAGGYDTISEYSYGGFNSLRLVAPGPLLPFSRNRQGMKLAEGYGIVMLERLSDAKKRAAPIHALISGFGESADAHHLTQPHPQGRGATASMTSALKSANLLPSQIQLIAAHATATPDNDAGEYAALSNTFGEHLQAIPVVAFKSHLGHTLGGAGAVELILSSRALRDQRIPPCANSRRDDVQFPALNLSTELQTANLHNTLNTSLGFGGANTCMILSSPSTGIPGEGRVGGMPGVMQNEKLDAGFNSAFDKIPHPGPPPQYQGSGDNPLSLHPVAITGIGVLVPSGIGNEAFVKRFSNPDNLASYIPGSIPEAEYLHLLNARRIRRMSDYVKLSLAAANAACANAGVLTNAEFLQGCSVLLGTTHGSSSFCSQYYGDIVAQGLIGANPTLFAEGVPNAAAAHLSLMLGIQGACQTLIGTRTAGLAALNLAALRISSGQWDRAVVGAAEEYCPTVDDVYRHCRLYATGERASAFEAETGFVSAPGAVCFVLENAASARHANRPIHALITSSAAAHQSSTRTAEGVASVLDQIGMPMPLICSANATWIDRAEQFGISRQWPGIKPISIYGPLAESFSAGPLAAIAAVLLGALQLPKPNFTTLCTDYSGCISATAISMVQ